MIPYSESLSIRPLIYGRRRIKEGGEINTLCELCSKSTWKTYSNSAKRIPRYQEVRAKGDVSSYINNVNKVIWFFRCYLCSLKAEKIKFVIKNFFSQCEQMRSLLKTFFSENFISCAILVSRWSWQFFRVVHHYFKKWWYHFPFMCILVTPNLHNLEQPALQESLWPDN